MWFLKDGVWTVVLCVRACGCVCVCVCVCAFSYWYIILLCFSLIYNLHFVSALT